MNNDQIVDECFDSLPGNLDQNEDRAKALIKSAIEKARGIKTTEYAKGWDDHIAAVCAAHATASEPWTYAKEDGSWIIRQRGIEIGMAYSEASASSLVATHNATCL